MDDTNKKKILIVDDDPGDIRWMRNLINSNCEVIEIRDGSRAVEMAAKENPALIFLDVMMPMVSGYTVCAHLKRNPNTKGIPVVMVTGLGTEINMKIGKEMGANGYLVKPIKPDQLRDVFNKYLTQDKEQ